MPYLRNGWYVGATSDEIPVGQTLARTLLDEPIVLFRDNATGEVAALEDRCCHRGAPLSLGEISDRGLVCGYHGLVFNARGVCVEIPHGGRISERARVRCYPVREQGGFVWIWMGNPDGAAEELIPSIPDRSDHDDGQPRYAHGMLHVQANYTLFLENLMDLTHLAYVHKKTIGGHAEDHTGATTETSQTHRGVKFTRLMLGVVPPPNYLERYGYRGRIDRWEEFEYVAPASVLQWTGAVDAGHYQQGVRHGDHDLRAIHTFAPETKRSCRYFFSLLSGYEGDRGKTTIGAPVVLTEDVRMVEQQQLRLDGYDMQRLTAIPSDVARVEMIRYLTRKIAEEDSDALHGQRS